MSYFFGDEVRTLIQRALFYSITSAPFFPQLKADVLFVKVNFLHQVSHPKADAMASESLCHFLSISHSRIRSHTSKVLSQEVNGGSLFKDPMCAG
jgi:hypothetical protein